MYNSPEAHSSLLTTQVKKMARCEASPRARGVHAACTRRAFFRDSPACCHCERTASVYHLSVSSLRMNFVPLRVYCECLSCQCELAAITIQATACTLRLFFILLRAPCEHISSHCVHTATVFYSTASPLRSHFKPLRAHCDCFLFYREHPAITFSRSTKWWIH